MVAAASIAVAITKSILLALEDFAYSNAGI